MKYKSDKLFELLYKLLKHRKPDTSRGDLGPSESWDDYETGYEIREYAALELGETKDPRAISKLEEALYDHGDAQGCSEGRNIFYFYGAEQVQKAAVEALSMIGGDDAIKALEKKLEDIDKRTRYKSYPLLPYEGVSKINIIKSLGDIPHEKSKEILRRIFNESYPSDSYDIPWPKNFEDLNLGIAAAMSLKKLGEPIDRVILEQGRMSYMGTSNQISGINGAVVNIGSRPVRVHIHTKILSSIKEIPIFIETGILKQDERAMFTFQLKYFENKPLFEHENMKCGILKLKYGSVI